ncbi:MAG: hypothetical protein J4472_03505, partial [DPANN group archaeon]|nr:hypothetical protein [DPANN group archaeon]
GRIIVMVDQDKKGPGLFEFVSHDLVKELKKFKSEPPILHVACKTLEDAETFLIKAQNAGWKRSGIISLRRNIVVEIISTDKLEFPLVKNGKLLVDEEFLKIVLEKVNENLKKGWRKIEKLKKII